MMCIGHSQFLVRASSIKNFVVYYPYRRVLAGVILYIRKAPNFELHTLVQNLNSPLFCIYTRGYSYYNDKILL